MKVYEKLFHCNRINKAYPSSGHLKGHHPHSPPVYTEGVAFPDHLIKNCEIKLCIHLKASKCSKME